jgi:hypothetical protein
MILSIAAKAKSCPGKSVTRRPLTTFPYSPLIRSDLERQLLNALTDTTDW